MEKITEDEYIKGIRDSFFNKEDLLHLVVQRPWNVIEKIHRFRKESYAEEIMWKATETESGCKGLTHYFERYKNEPYAKDIFMKALEKDQNSVFYKIEKYKDEDWAKEVLLANIKNEKNAEQAFYQFDKYNDKGYAADVLLKAAEYSSGDLLYN